MRRLVSRTKRLSYATQRIEARYDTDSADSNNSVTTVGEGASAGHAFHVPQPHICEWRKPVFPHWPRVRRSGDRAGHDGRIQNGSAISSAEFDYFISAGDIRQDLLFDVENLRDGRSFSARRVNVTQAQGSILTAIASFQEQGQDGIEFADPMPEGVPEPETLTSAKQLMEPFAEKSSYAKYYAEKSPFDIRHVTRTIMLGADKKSASNDSGKQLVWMKADGTVDVPQVMHRAMLAMGCDQVMLEPVLRRAGLSIATPGISFASIDHSMWWYRDIDINQWHLYVQDTPTAAHGRGLGQAKVYTQDGELVACMTQEAMIRVPEEDLKK